MVSVKEIWNLLGTAYKDLSLESREKIEGVWEALVSLNNSLYKMIYQRSFNTSITESFPFFTEDTKFIELQATTVSGLELIETDSINEQTIPFNLIYVESIISNNQTFTYDSALYSNTLESDSTKELVRGSIYVLTTSGLESGVGFWENDSLVTGYDLNYYYDIFSPYASGVQNG